eukprot:TRINITY_DN11109_c0_g1_i1.p1 TRINITY_DN11109_c0_g1~~TRINITY_DN11109_c0_g1_i1.p1  ORF type:complete len:575 (-),score=139.57 TRINITY_DN11109_c0_g1_i1:35-1699(-)
MTGMMGQGEVADLIICYTKIWTGDQENPFVEAIAIKDGKIISVGRTTTVIELAGKDTQIIDGRDRIGLITPGFIDSHVHLLMGGFGLNSVKLRDAHSKQEFIDRIGEFARNQPKGRWIREGMWNHENWGGELPEHHWIDSVTPDHPVFVCRSDGHMCLANALALKLANITKSTSEVSGGTIVRNEQGHPTGILKDRAMELLTKAIPPPSYEESKAALKAAMEYVTSNGVTTVHHMSFTFDDLYVFDRAHKEGDLDLRIYVATPLLEWKRLKDHIDIHGRGDDMLKLGNLKAFTDGSLGSHTALMMEPYSDHPNDTGLLLTSKADLASNLEGATSAGLQSSIHAIGDAATHLLLDVYEEYIAKHGMADYRFRIEHAQTLQKDDVKRFRNLNVIASMQPYHLMDDGIFAERLLGDRIHNMYVFRSLLDANVTLSFGSDWFVAPPTPIEGIFAAVTRSVVDGSYPDGWIPMEKVRLEEALKCYTTNAAFASFDEKIKGKIAKGYLADLTLLDTDLFEIVASGKPRDIIKTKVIGTLINGKMVHESPSLKIRSQHDEM